MAARSTALLIRVSLGALCMYCSYGVHAEFADLSMHVPISEAAPALFFGTYTRP